MSNKSTSLFDVDPTGLAKLLEARGKGFAVVELVSNAWDTAATEVDVVIEPIPGRPLARLTVVDDDPDGFADLRHAYTLFAESTRKVNPEQRGRFNLGEKLVIALCETSEIRTTKGTLIFGPDGRRETRERRMAGSEFTGMIRMTREEYAEAVDLLHRLIVPDQINRFAVNGEPVRPRTPIAAFDVTLPTVLADADGNLRPTERRTSVRVYEPVGTPSLYELGVPVVETGDAYDIDVAQKVPLNMERDNVTPSYLRKVRSAVLNETHDRLDPAQAKATWVTAALEDPNVDGVAVRTVIRHRFGPKAVIYDPSDVEGTKLATARGYTVIPPGTFNRAQWDAVRNAGIRPAGQVTPSLAKRLADSDGPAMRMLAPDDWSPKVREVVEYAREIGWLLLGFRPNVEIGNDPMFPAAATYGGRTLMLNRGRLGERWFASITEETDALLLHEFAHHRVSDHLSSGFADEIARLGAKLVTAALFVPESFARRATPLLRAPAATTPPSATCSPTKDDEEDDDEIPPRNLRRETGGPETLEEIRPDPRRSVSDRSASGRTP